MAEEDDDFDKLLADKQHKEILQELRRLNKAIAEDNSMNRLLDENQKTITLIIESIKKINPTTVDQDNVVKAIENMAKTLSVELSKIKKEPTDYIFELNHGIGGRIESIKATAIK